jgi:phosphohistidine swiveling domain-containing protein
LQHLKQLSTISRSRRIGNKARYLRFLQRKGYPIPETWVLDQHFSTRYQQNAPEMATALEAELAAKLSPDKAYAVRSSGALEDQTGFSFAGQYQTLLNVKGTREILQAIKSVWQSGQGVQEGEYIQHTTGAGGQPGMGVIIQEMVAAQWSGVAFSINPVTGRAEYVIEGITGLGDALVQGTATPQRWTYGQGNWQGLENAPSPGPTVLTELVEGVQKLRKQLRKEVDVEWAYDGQRLYYLQCRPVTAQKYPTIYANHISREVLPGMIKPLVWSVNIPLVNSAWIRLLEGLLGKLDLQPAQLSHSFYYRAYFNMGTMGSLFRKMGMPRDSLESLMGRKDPSGKSAFKPKAKTLLFLPRMTWFLLTHLNLGRRFKRALPRIQAQIAQLDRQLDEEFSVGKYPDFFEQIMALGKEVAYFNIIIPLTMMITHRILHRKMDKRGLSADELDFAAEFPELLDFAPQYRIKELHSIWETLPEEAKSKSKSFEDLAHSADGRQLKEGIIGLLRQFGHFSESGNDFSYPHWAEDPDFVLKMIQGSEGNKTKEKQIEQDQAARKLGAAYRRAGKFRLYREMVSSAYTRAYGLFRKLFLKTGTYLVQNGKLEKATDVFYLSLAEHDALLATRDPQLIKQSIEQVNKVRTEMTRYADLSLPSVIYGEVPPPLELSEEKTYRGIPVSPGIFEGEITIVKGYRDFDKVVAGRILVIPFADVGWTPILARAGAIVSESGGMLSHASIVARELSIPAIASVDHVCSRLKDGIRARLDGHNGLLILENGTDGNFAT